MTESYTDLSKLNPDSNKAAIAGSQYVGPAIELVGSPIQLDNLSLYPFIIGRFVLAERLSRLFENVRLFLREPKC